MRINRALPPTRQPSSAAHRNGYARHCKNRYRRIGNRTDAYNCIDKAAGHAVARAELATVHGVGHRDVRIAIFQTVRDRCRREGCEKWNVNGAESAEWRIRDGRDNLNTLYPTESPAGSPCRTPQSLRVRLRTSLTIRAVDQTCSLCAAGSASYSPSEPDATGDDDHIEGVRHTHHRESSSLAKRPPGFLRGRGTHYPSKCPLQSVAPGGADPSRMSVLVISAFAFLNQRLRTPCNTFQVNCLMLNGAIRA